MATGRRMNCSMLFSIIIKFWITTAQSSEDVVLTSTLADDHTAPPNEEIVFTCTTRGSSILQWSSIEYIDSDGYNIQVYNSTLGNDVQRGSAHATLVRAAIENGVLVLVSELRIRTNTLHPTATIECNNNGHGSSRTIRFALQNVTLTSTLTDGLVAYGEEEIIFTCTTRGSSILRWSSIEYIDSDGYNIQIYNSTLGNDVQRGSAHATLVRAAIENGVLVLVSELCIRTNTLHPTATIECNNNGHGSSRNITFALQNVTLTSTLTDLVAYGEQEIIFTCTVRHSSILQWSSIEYIDSDGYNIQVYNSTLGNDVQRGSAHATLVRAAIESGVLVLVSELRVRTNTLHPTATIECNNNGHGSSRTITFNSIDRPIPRLNSSLTEGMFVCPGDRIQFQCATTHSQSLGWLSDVYFGSDAAIHFSYDSPLNSSQEISGMHHAILTNKSMENGRIDLTAMLSITVLDSRESSHSVVCLNGDVGTSTTISFHLAEMCKESTTTSMSNVKSGSNDDSQDNLPVSTVIVPVVVLVTVIAIAAAIIGVIVILTITHKGKSNKVGFCIGDQMLENQYEAGGTYHKDKIQEGASPTSFSSSTISSDNKSILHSGSTRSSVVVGSMGSAQDLRQDESA